MTANLGPDPYTDDRFCVEPDMLASKTINPLILNQKMVTVVKPLRQDTDTAFKMI